MRRTLALITLVLGTWLLLPAWAQTPGWFSRVNIGSTTGTSCTLTRGAGSPESVVTGSICDVYLRTDGVAGTTIYVKESGTATTTGWRAQPALASPVTAATGGTGQDTSAWSGLPSINAGTWTQNNVLTSTRILFAGASNTVTSDADWTFDTATNTPSATGGYKERSRSTAMGEWITPAFSAGDFTANASMTWTLTAGDVTNFQYTLIGKSLVVNFYLESTSVGGTPSTQLRIAIPASATAATYTSSLSGWASDAGGAKEPIYIELSPGATYIGIHLLDLSNWTASTNTTSVAGQITFEVQ